MISKQTLIDLFDRKDKKRRRILYELYAGQIQSSLSAVYIAEMISADLQRPDLIGAADVKFCRFHFKNKLVKTVTVQRPIPKQTETRREAAPGPPENQPDVVWSGVENIDNQESIIVKFKHTKNHET